MASIPAAISSRRAANWLPSSPDTNRTAASSSFPEITGGGGGNSADTGSRTGPADSRCRVVVRLDDRPAGHHDLLFDASLQPAGPRHGELRRTGELPIFSDRSGVSDLPAEHPGAGRLGACNHD